MNFAEYLWTLLPRPFKLNEDSEIQKYTKVIGTTLDDGKSAVFAIRRSWFIRTAPIEVLEIIGEGLLLPKKAGETDSIYRERLVNAYDWYLWGGTKKGVLRAIASVIDVPCRVREFFDNAWKLGKSRLGVETRLFDADFTFVFSITFERELTIAEEQMVRDVVEISKPAHTNYFIVYPIDTINTFWRLSKSHLGKDTILKGA